MGASIQWDTGYSLFFIAGLAIWVGVPILNSMFGVGTMTGYLTLPIIGTQQMNVVFGGGLMALGLISYAGFRW